MSIELVPELVPVVNKVSQSVCVRWKMNTVKQVAMEIQNKEPVWKKNSWRRGLRWPEYTDRWTDMRVYASSSLGFTDSSVGTEWACNAGDPSSIPGLGRSAGEGIGYPLQYFQAFPVAQLQNPPAIWETWVQSLGWEDP